MGCVFHGSGRILRSIREDGPCSGRKSPIHNTLEACCSAEKSWHRKTQVEGMQASANADENKRFGQALWWSWCQYFADLSQRRKKASHNNFSPESELSTNGVKKPEAIL